MINKLFNLSSTISAPLFKEAEYPWQVLSHISAFILRLGEALNEADFYKKENDIWISKTAKISDTAFLKGPLIIDHGAEIRQGAFIRGSAIIGKGSVVGNSTEIKNSILFDKVQVPHFNYIGDSVLGYMAHFGAGALTSNVKSDKTCVSVRCGEDKIFTDLKKFGAMVGDNVEIGCNTVLCPGAVIGKNTNIYPLSMVRGYVEENSIYKNKNEIIKKR